MILCVTGSRHWTDYSAVWKALAEDKAAGFVTLYHGAAEGADTIAAHAGERLGFIVRAIPVDTAIDGPWPGAGMARNRRMLVMAMPHALRVFRAAGRSNGADGCVRLAEAMKIRILR